MKNNLGLTAALLLSVTPTFTQLSVLGIADMVMLALALGSVYMCLKRRYCWSGALFGLACGTKLLAGPIVGVLVWLIARQEGCGKKVWLLLGVSVIAFFIVEPHILMNWSKFIDALRHLWGEYGI